MYFSLSFVLVERRHEVAGNIQADPLWCLAPMSPQPNAPMGPCSVVRACSQCVRNIYRTGSVEEAHCRRLSHPHGLRISFILTLLRLSPFREFGR